MNFKEFKREILQISQEPFISTKLHPLELGIQRAEFEQQKLKRLIAAAEQVTSLTARRRMEGWRRQLEKTERTQERLEKMKAEVPSPCLSLR